MTHLHLRDVSSRVHEVARTQLSPIADPDVWNVPDITPFVVRQGEAESPLYRLLQLEFLLLRTSEQFIPFGEVDILLRDQKSDRFVFNDMTNPSAVGVPLPEGQRIFAPIPSVIREAFQTFGLAFPCLRSLYYFGDIHHATESYGLTGEQAAVFVDNLMEATGFEWAQLLAVAFEAYFRATDRVILQPTSAAE